MNIMTTLAELAAYGREVVEKDEPKNPNRQVELRKREDGTMLLRITSDNDNGSRGFTTICEILPALVQYTPFREKSAISDLEFLEWTKLVLPLHTEGSGMDYTEFA